MTKGIIISLLFIALASWSCSDDDTTTISPNGNNLGIITARINNQPFSERIGTAFFFDKRLSIGSAQGPESYINIPEAQLGTFTISNPPTPYQFRLEFQEMSLVPISGTFSITTLNSSTALGVFEFTAQATSDSTNGEYIVSNGIFEVNF